MGFSGGGSNITKPHTHDSTIVQDGGSLAANVTQFGLSAGSVLYSDGSNIQELAVGSAADTLTVNAGATAPEWAAAAAGSGSFTIDGTDSSAGGAGTLQVAGMTGRDITQVLFHVANDGTNARLLLRINGLATGTYNTRWWTSDGVGTFITGQTAYFLSESLADQDFQGEVLLYKGNTNLGYTGNVIRTMVGTINAAAATPQTYQVIMGSGNQADTSAITQIDLLCSGGNIIGDLQVNSMNYQ